MNTLYVYVWSTLPNLLLKMQCVSFTDFVQYITIIGIPRGRPNDVLVNNEAPRGENINVFPCWL